MKTLYVFIAVLLLQASHGSADNRPDSVKIMWQHSSVGQRIMNARLESFKSRLDSLGGAESWPIGIWDYRTNSDPGDNWAGWRTARFDSADHKSGWVIGDVYGYCSNNMWLDHLTRFWDDTSSMKAGLLHRDTVIDSDPDPDTLVDITQYNCIWFLPAYWHWGNIEDDSLASYRTQALSWRDSAAEYPNIVFVYIMQVPMKAGAYVENTYSYTANEKANAFSFDAFWWDTLQDTADWPNFLTWSLFDMLVEKSVDSSNWACIETIYEGTDDHPNTAANEIMQDSLVTAWTPRLLEYMDSVLWLNIRQKCLSGQTPEEINQMNINRKTTLVLLLVLLASSPVRAQWDFFISGSDTADCADTYMRSNLPTTNYGSDATMLFGSQWNTMTILIAFPHLSDSLALPVYEGDIDSAFIGLVCTGSIEAGDTLSMKACTCKRDWVENEATWNEFASGDDWATAGAAGGDDRFDDAPADTLILHDGSTAALDTVYVRLGVNFSMAFESAVLDMSYEAGTEAIYLGFYSSDHSSAVGPFLHVFGGSSGGGEDSSAPDSYDALNAIAVLHLDPDSVKLGIGSVDSTDLERTIIRWDTTSIPEDTTDGYSLYAGAAVENENDDFALSLVQPDWVYFSIFALDVAGNASSAVSDSIYLPGGGEGGTTTGRTNRMFEYLISKQENINK